MAILGTETDGDPGGVTITATPGEKFTSACAVATVSGVIRVTFRAKAETVEDPCDDEADE